MSDIDEPMEVEQVNQDEVETQLPQVDQDEVETQLPQVDQDEVETQLPEAEKSKIPDDEQETALIVPPEEEEDIATAEIEEESKENDQNADNAETVPVDAAAEPKAEKLTRLPLGPVKRIMKMDPDTKMASQDAVFLVAKATELFVDSLAKECYSYTTQNKKKTIARIDIDTAIDATDCLAFLEGALED